MVSRVQSTTRDYIRAFIKRHVVERTKRAEVGPEEQSEKTTMETCRENLWNEIQLKGP